MAGMIQDQMAQNQATTQPNAPQQPQNGMVNVAQQGNEADNESVTPEEQAQYDALVSQATDMIHGEKGYKSILQILKSAPDPVEGVAKAVVTVGAPIVNGAKKAGKQIPDDVLTHAAGEIVAQLFEFAESAGVVKGHTADDEFSAYTRALELWDQTNPGSMDKEAMKQSMSQIPQDKVSNIMKQLQKAA